MGQLNSGSICRRAAKPENKMSDGINLIAFPALEGGEACCGLLRVIGGQIEVRQNDHEAFTVTMVAGFCQLICSPDAGMNIFMVGNQAMQQYFWGDTEGECKQ